MEREEKERGKGFTGKWKTRKEGFREKREESESRALEEKGRKGMRGFRGKGK